MTTGKPNNRKTRKILSLLSNPKSFKDCRQSLKGLGFDSNDAMARPIGWVEEAQQSYGPRPLPLAKPRVTKSPGLGLLVLPMGEGVGLPDLEFA